MRKLSFEGLEARELKTVDGGFDLTPAETEISTSVFAVEETNSESDGAFAPPFA